MSVRRRIWYLLQRLCDWLIPEERDLRYAQFGLLTAARNAASKLRCEMNPRRNSVTPKAEYDILIEETAKYSEAWRRAFKR